VALFSVMTDY